MGTSSLNYDNPLRPGKKRSFSLPSFRKASEERPTEVQQTNAEEVARVRKAAAWQWYTRGVGEVVAPTKASRRAVAPGHSPPLQVGDNINKQQQQMPLESQLPEPQRAASRFKTEASAPRPTPTSAAGAAPSTPLYDEFELSGLRTHMADLVQRLQKQQKAQDELQVAGDQKTKTHSSTVAGGLTAAAPSTTAFHRPLSALHRFFRRVISGSIMKNTKNSPTIITTPSPLAPLVDEKEDSEYHYHHYIHHHHHHYHYGTSPEDGASVIRRRRHSESSTIRALQTPSPWEEVEEDYGEEEEESPIQAYLARRRRHSDSFGDHNFPPKLAVSYEEEEGHPVMLQLPRRYNSERFMSTTPSKIPVGGLVSKGSKGSIDEVLMQSTDIRSRRRQSAEILREGGRSFNTKPGEGGAALGGGKTERARTYKLGGAHGGAAPATTQVARRRHSEGLHASLIRREMSMRGNRTPSPASSGSMKVPMTPLWQSPHLPPP